MILSVSRRTDIPAFYMDWFMKRYKEGYVLTMNPMNRKQVSRISFSDVSALVFWTKNPKNLLRCIDKINHKTLVHVTITPYTKEEDIKSKSEVISDTVLLSKKLQGNLIWRYDPIMINETYNTNYHLKYFERLCERFEGHIDKCIVSFLEPYKKIQSILNNYDLPDQSYKHSLIAALNDIANKHGIQIMSCCEDLGIKKSACIDGSILKISGYKKDPYQREGCNCIESIDIGAYNTCIHGCIYCYANYDHKKAHSFYDQFDSDQKHLGPKFQGDETIKVRKIKVNRQISLFDKEIIK